MHKTINVLYVIDSLDGGGAETSLVEIMPFLAARQIVITVVSLLADDGLLAGRLEAAGFRCISLAPLPLLAKVFHLNSVI